MFLRIDTEDVFGNTDEVRSGVNKFNFDRSFSASGTSQSVRQSLAEAVSWKMMVKGSYYGLIIPVVITFTSIKRGHCCHYVVSVDFPPEFPSSSTVALNVRGPP